MGYKCLLISILGLFFLVTSCSKDDDWTSQRDNILGTWDGVADFQKLFEDGSSTVGSKRISVVFKDERKCTVTQNTFVISEFDWLYQPSPERISLTRDLGTFSGNLPTVFDIKTNTSETQLWVGEYEELFFDPSTSTTSRAIVSETWTLNR